MQFIFLLLLKYRYLILFPLAAFEGPVVSILVGFLVYSGVFSFWLAYAVLLFGDIIPDTIFYYIGYFGHQTEFVQKYFLRKDFFIQHMDIVKKLWTLHGRKTMFFGKLAYGMALPFLVSAGVVKIPYKKFISYAIPISLFQYGLLMSVGYYMGNSFNLALKYVDYAYFLIAGFVVIFIVAYMFVVKYAHNKIILMEKEELNGNT